MSQKKVQAYKNRTAYKVQFNPKFEDITSNAPLDRLCQRCFDQIKWKIQYGKYKQRPTVSRCNKCQNKNIIKAYRTLCDKCADKEQLCTKCGKSKELVPDPGDEPKLDKNGIDKKKLHEMEEYMETLRERSRRKILRLINKGQIDWNGEYFVDVETGEGIDGIKFKGDIENMEDNWDDDEDDGDFDEDDDMDQDDDNDEDDESEKKDKKKSKAPEKEKGKEQEKIKKEEEKAPEPEQNEEEIIEIKKIVKEKVEEPKNEGTKKKQDKGKKKKKKQDSSDDDDLSGFSDL